MIFDSPRLIFLLKKYKNHPVFLVPKIVQCAKDEGLENERTLLEGTIEKASTNKQRDWVGRLINVDDAQYLSAWFEIMLVDWIKDVGIVEIEPEVEGNHPDLSVKINNEKIIIESRVVRKSISEIAEENLTNWIFWALMKVNEPYFVHVLDARASKNPNLREFCSQVQQWLENNPKERFSYEDGTATIVMEVLGESCPQIKSIHPSGSIGGAKWITSEPLKPPLQEKAHQHQKIRTASLPYIIAIFLESPLLSAEEVARAWFGEEKWVVKAVGDEYKVVDSYIDRSGIQFYGSEIQHTSVSGTLVFKADFSQSDKRHYLKSWFIQNPFAKTPIDFASLPVQGSLIVLERSEKGFRMGWQDAR